MQSTAVSQRSAESKSARSEVSKAQGELREAKEEITSLEGKVETLGAQVRTLREREKDARAELDSWLKDEKSREGSVSRVPGPSDGSDGFRRAKSAKSYG